MVALSLGMEQGLSVGMPSRRIGRLIGVKIMISKIQLARIPSPMTTSLSTNSAMMTSSRHKIAQKKIAKKLIRNMNQLASFPPITLIAASYLLHVNITRTSCSVFSSNFSTSSTIYTRTSLFTETSELRLYLSNNVTMKFLCSFIISKMLLSYKTKTKEFMDTNLKGSITAPQKLSEQTLVTLQRQMNMPLGSQHTTCSQVESSLTRYHPL